MPYRLETRLFLPAPIDHVFDYFSSPLNLEAITPPFLRFRVVTLAGEMRKGARIRYACGCTVSRSAGKAR